MSRAQASTRIQAERTAVGGCTVASTAAARFDVEEVVQRTKSRRLLLLLLLRCRFLPFSSLLLRSHRQRVVHSVAVPESDLRCCFATQSCAFVGDDVVHLGCVVVAAVVVPAALVALVPEVVARGCEVVCAKHPKHDADAAAENLLVGFVAVAVAAVVTQEASQQSK